MEWNRMVPEMLVSDFKHSLDFYTKVLGFKIVHRRENPYFAYLDLGGAQVMLEQQHQEAWNADKLEAPYGRGINFQIEVDDVDKVYTSVQNEQIELYKEIKESWYKTSDTEEGGQREFLVRDPDGYLLRFFQHLGEREIS